MAIHEDLRWLGFDWLKPVRRQSDHFKDYDAALKMLREKGLVYRCFKTRREILDDIARAPHGAGEVYRGPVTLMSADEEAERVAKDETYAWRLSLAQCREYLGEAYHRLVFQNNGKTVKARPVRLGDIILARKDIGTSYHLACTHDDARQGMTDIVRGNDLLDSTHIHRLLQAVMDWPVPNYHHHELFLDGNGRRLAKRNSVMALRSIRENGAKPENVLVRVRTLG